MADGELYNWMRSMQSCHAKHIGGPPPLHQRIAYAEAYGDPARTRRFATWGRRLLGRMLLSAFVRVRPRPKL